MDDFTRELRYAVRALRKSPGFTAAAAATLALGIGATTAIFSAVYGLLLAPLPFPHSQRLAVLWERNPEKGWEKNWVAAANYLDWRQRLGSFQDVAAYTDRLESLTLSGSGDASVVHGVSGSGNLFTVLGIRPQLGRGFRDEETWATSPRVVLLSDALWRRRFGADPGIVGRTLRLDGQPHEVIGVAPPDLRFPLAQVEYWRTLHQDPADRQEIWFRRAHWLRVVGRLKPGVAFSAAESELASVAARLEREYPATNRQMGAGITPLRDWLAGNTRIPLRILFAAVGLLLLIACANVGNLLLVRGAGRRREMAVRAALGASRSRLIAQLAAESLLLALLGGSLGLAVAAWGLPILKALRPPDLEELDSIALNGTVLLFAVGATFASGLLFGTSPALRILKLDSGENLKGAVGDAAGPRRGPLGGMLIVGELALSLLLFLGATLSARSFWKLTHVDPGFDQRSRVSVSLSLPAPSYPKEENLVAFEQELRGRLLGLPGVRSVGATSQLPLTGADWSSDFSVRGRGPDDYGVEVIHREVSPDYFATMGIPILRGRDFRQADRPDGLPVILINEALARKYFANEAPIGRQVCFDRVPDARSIWRTIVGVVANERQSSLSTEPQEEIFAPLSQSPNRTLHFVLHASGDAGSLIRAVRATVKALDPNLALAEARTLEEVRSGSLGRDRFLLLLLGAFASSAILLAVVGVYGVTSHDARNRTREIGIRLAVGASTSDVKRLVLGRSVRLALLGTSLGVAGALATARVMRAVLYQVSPNDPACLAMVVVLLIAVAAVAGYLPARRAARVDPMVALRAD